MENASTETSNGFVDDECPCCGVTCGAAFEVEQSVTTVGLKMDKLRID